mmetsp:Transcript_15618/g.24287  ORF Transcript_15618/g.24287 Transcript_15618/m.24287 type:complete len:321 (+) Transcript_15618:70-1032(+)
MTYHNTMKVMFLISLQLSICGGLVSSPQLYHRASLYRSTQCEASCRNNRGNGQRREISPLYMNFFKGLFEEAFSNDVTLSDDSSEGQVDYYDEDRSSTVVDQRALQARGFIARTSAATSGAPIKADQLVGTKWSIQLYLAGIPDRDPSSNLYGSRVNISSRDKNFDVGVNVPEEPTLTVEVHLCEDGVCKASETEFTTGLDGQWRLFDGNLLRISMDCTGYQRRVSVTGTITKVFWSDEKEVSSQTSSTFTIPPGLIYADAKVKYGQPGEFLMDVGNQNGKDNVDTIGLLRIEKKTGVLGAASKMIPCGKFDASMILPPV